MPLLSEIDGWTPIIDELAKERGLVSAAVFGVVWRHCQLDNKVCHAALETMAEKIGVHRTVVLKHIKKLCADGYLEDLTPGVRNAPHTYADTGKAGLDGEIKAKKPKTVAHSTPTVAHSTPTVAHSTPTVAHSTPTVAHSTPTVAVSDLKRLSEETLEETGGGGKPPPDFEELAKKAITIYSEAAQMKLDKIQAKAITNLIKELSNFNLDRWRAACDSTRLAGVRVENVKCRIDTYRAGGDYQAMVSGRRNGGQLDAPASRPVKLDEAKRAAYEAQLAADRADIAETTARVEGIIDRPNSVGVDIEKEIRKEIRKVIKKS